MWDRSSFDPTGDFEDIVDGIEELSFYRFDPTTDTYDDDITIRGFCFQTGDNMVTLSNGETTSVDLVIHTSKMDFESSGFKPRRFDKIEREENKGEDGDEATTTYIVQQVKWQTFGTRYRLDCNRQLTS